MKNSSIAFGAGFRTAVVLAIALCLSPVPGFAQEEFQGVYLGSFDDLDDDFGEFGIAVFDDGTATILLYDGFDFAGFAASGVVINPDGSFIDADVDGLGTSVMGSFVDGHVSGTVLWFDGRTFDFAAVRSPNNGFFQPNAGYYSGPVAGDLFLDGSFIGDFVGDAYAVSDSQGNSFTYIGTIITTQVGDIPFDFGGLFDVAPDGTILDNLFDGELFQGLYDFATLSGNGTLSFNEIGVALNADWDYDIQEPVFDGPLHTPTLIGLGDVNGADGASDMAVLLTDMGTGDLDLIIKDGGTGDDINGAGQSKSSGQPLMKASLGMVAAAGLGSVPDVNANNAEEVAVLLINPNATYRVSLYDAGTGALLRNLTYAPAYTPVAMGVIDDIDGQGTPAIAVLGRDELNNVRVQIKSAVDGSQIRNVQFAPNFPPKFMVIVPDVSGNGISELAVLGIDAGGNIRVQLKDAGTGALIHWIQFAAAFSTKAMVVVPDIDGGSAPAIAVLGEHLDGRISAQVKDAMTRQPVHQGRLNFARAYDFQALTVVGDIDGNNVSELVYLGIDSLGNIRAQIKDSFSKSAVSLVFFAKTFTPHAIAPFADGNGNGFDDLGVLGTNPNNGNSRVQIKDSQNGDEVSVVFVP